MASLENGQAVPRALDAGRLVQSGGVGTSLRANRILESFQALRLLSVAIQGTQHSKEAAGIATRRIWLTPQPKPAQKSF